MNELKRDLVPGVLYKNFPLFYFGGANVVHNQYNHKNNIDYKRGMSSWT